MYFRSYLYASVLDKPRSGMPSAKPGKQTTTNPAVSAPKALICRSKVKSDDLINLIKMFETFRGELATELTRQNYLRRHVEETQSILVNVDDECLDRNKVLLILGKPQGGRGSGAEKAILGKGHVFGPQKCLFL